MKRCTYCGKEYPDGATICGTDGQPLVPVEPPPSVPPLTAESGQTNTRKLLTYVAPLRAGIVLGALYGFLGLIFTPILILAAFIGQKTGGVPGLFGGLFLALAIPVFYTIAGFIGGLIGAVIYNLIARWTGGFEFELRDCPRLPVY